MNSTRIHTIVLTAACFLPVLAVAQETGRVSATVIPSVRYLQSVLDSTKTLNENAAPAGAAPAAAAPPAAPIPAVDCAGPNPQTCLITITFKINDSSGTPSCGMTWDQSVRVHDKQRAVRWELDVDATTKRDYLVQFADYPSIPAIALYDDTDFGAWVRRKPDVFIWRTRQKKLGAPTPYIVIVQFQKKPIDPRVQPSFCELRDPTIANDNDDVN